MRTFAAILTFFLAASVVTFSQTYHIACQVIGSAGNDASFQGNNYAFTVGEAVIATIGNASLPNILTQGFHQPECSELTAISDLPPQQEQLKVALFPNPTTGSLFLQFSPAPPAACILQIFNVLGQPVLPCFDFLPGEGQPVDGSALRPGYYFLQVQLSGERRNLALPFVKVE